MIVYGIIPARYGSTRFPGKALATIQGKTMIRRVYEQAVQVERFREVIVATDDERIMAEVEAFGGKARITATTHQSGTERCAEVALQLKRADIIVNIQGDEPYLAPEQIDELVDVLLAEPAAAVATLAKMISDPSDLANINVVKVVLSKIRRALYFSRQPIPFQRDLPVGEWLVSHVYFKHIGLYAYRREGLIRLAELAPTPLETAERLEQLRWLERGFEIAVGITEYDSFGVDVPEDIQRLEAWLDGKV